MPCIFKDMTNSLKSGLANFKFKNNSGKAQYSMNGGTSWTNFRNPVGTAAAADVLAGKTFANASSDSVAGTMTNRGAWNSSPTASGNVTIPAGYHNGSGYVNTAGVYTAGYNAGKASASVNLSRVSMASTISKKYSGANNTEVRNVAVTISGGYVICTVSVIEMDDDGSWDSTDEVYKAALKYT